MADVFVGDKATVTPAATDKVLVLKDGAVGLALISAAADAGIGASAAIDALEAADVALDARLDTAESTLTSHGSRLTTAEADISALEAADIVLDGRLDTAETTITSQGSAITALQTATTATAIVAAIDASPTAESALATALVGNATAAESLGNGATFLPPGTGMVSRSVPGRLSECVSVLDAIPVSLHAGILAGTNTTNLETYIQAAADYCNSTGKTLRFPGISCLDNRDSPVGYRTGAQVSFTGKYRVIMDSPIVAHQTSGTAIFFGAAIDASQYNVAAELRVVKSTTNWSQNVTGIHIRNVLVGAIHIYEASRFTKGVVLDGDGKGLEQINFFLYDIIRNKYGLYFQKNGALGYVNECNFFGGSFQHYSGENAGEARYGMYFAAPTNGATPSDQLIFYKPMFQLAASVASPAECVPIVSASTNACRWHGCRVEGSGTVAAVFSGTSQDNIVEINNDAITVTNDSSNAPNIRRSLSRYYRQLEHVVFDSGNLASTLNEYDGAGGEYWSNYLDIATTSAFGLRHSSALTINTDGSVNVNTGAPYPFLYADISLLNCRFLILKRSCGTGADDHGIVKICMFDASGTQLDDSVVRVKSVTAVGLFYLSAYGGVYLEAGSTLDTIPLQFHSSVARVYVGIGASTSTKLFRMMLLSGDGEQVVLNNKRHLPKATAVPSLTTQTYALGDRLGKANAAAGGSPGWVCTTAGSPGTWKAEAAVAA